MAMKSWREIAVPHEDVLKGSFQQAEFAADISRVHDGTATSEYQDPVMILQHPSIRIPSCSLSELLSQKGCAYCLIL